MTSGLALKRWPSIPSIPCRDLLSVGIGRTSLSPWAVPAFSVAFLPAFVALALSGSALAATVRVPGDQPTIPAGLDAVAAGDTVLVAPGAYSGDGNRNLDFRGKGVVLRSSAGASTTIIDPRNLGFAFYFHSGETTAAAVEGFTIRNASDGTYYGGGVFCSGASPTFRNCVFRQNPANQGAGIYCEWSSMALIDCQFLENAAVNWGGGAYFLNSSPSLTRCAFTQNTAGIGAGIYFSGGSGTLTDCTFTGNAASNQGGGIFCRNGASPTLTGCTFSGNSANHGAGLNFTASSPVLSSCSFISNTATYRGGAINAEDGPAFQVTGCTFTGNSNTSGTEPQPGGGAIYTYGAAPHLSDCVFSDNHAHGQTALGGAMKASWDAVLNNCTFTGNSCDWHGGALVTGSFDVVVGCSFSGNSAPYGGGLFAGGQLTLTGCRFSGNTAQLYGGGVYAWADLTASECTWFENSASQGGGIFFNTDETEHHHLSGCTFVRNSAGVGGGMMLYNQTLLPLDHTIIAFTASGGALVCQNLSEAVLSCCDIFGNAGGDWVGCIEDQFGINGCFAADPRFCDPHAGDLTLAEDSPCAPAHSPGGCGLIGALPVVCVVPVGVAEAGAPPVSAGLRIVPNPVVGAGAVEWVQPTPGAVTLRLYDPSGRVVLNRDLGRREAGRQRLRWAEMVGPEGPASGIYFLEVGGTRRREVARVLVIR